MQCGQRQQAAAAAAGKGGGGGLLSAMYIQYEITWRLMASVGVRRATRSTPLENGGALKIHWVHTSHIVYITYIRLCKLE